MSNGIICTNDLIIANGVTFTSSTEVSGYPKENVQIYQPGESFRTSVIDLGWLQADFVEVKPFDTLGVLYSNATAHRNLLQQSNTLDTSPWNKTNVTVTEGDEASLPVGGIGQSCYITDDATSGQHKVAQNWTAPGSGGLTHTTLTFGAYVAGVVGAAITECKLRIVDGSSNYCEVVFDLSTGTAASVATGGAEPFTAGAAAISPVASAVGSATWYEVILSGISGNATATGYSARILLMDGNGNGTYSGSSDSLLVNGATLEVGAPRRPSPTSILGDPSRSVPVATTTDTGALIRVTDSAGTIAGSEWNQLASGDTTSSGFTQWIKKFSSTVYADQPKVWIFDPDNADGYLEIGNFVVGTAFQPGKNIGSDWHVGWAEEGTSARAPGGQLYRPVNKRYRRAHMAHTWLTESEAWNEAYEIDRLVGRSEGVLVSIDPDGDHSDRQTIWGVQEELGAVVHRTYSTSEGGTVYAKEWDFIEALP